MRFSIVGISHWKSGVSIRELFYLDKQRRERLDHYTRTIPGGVLVLDTCNRTEVYGFCEPEVLVKALCQSTNTDPDYLHKHGYILTDDDAIRHIYKVGLGMDSQVLGDVQIIQQLKKAYKEANKANLAGEFHQLVQSVFRAHKRSRNETDFGKGNASVGYEATKQAIEFFGDLSDINILLIGAGKMGKVSCKNLVSNGAQHISVINRSINRAKNLASSFDIKAYSFEELEGKVKEADLIITATGATDPILKAGHFEGKSSQTMVIDLSVPRNVEQSVEELENVTLIDMDSITEVNQKAIEKRERALPLLEGIIEEEVNDYKDRIHRSHFLLPRIKEIDNRLQSITDDELDKVRNKMDSEAFDELELVTKRIKKKIMAIHINRLDEEYKRVKDEV
ncbi:glutamyl-tRNA reductase [Balneola sp. MJW-20]|uniref:glutamyl-tRNA reductase n=1 Tax=Gracilimonas aurantiaca TaxID=3234185 RepID=UPI0034657D63